EPGTRLSRLRARGLGRAVPAARRGDRGRRSARPRGPRSGPVLRQARAAQSRAFARSGAAARPGLPTYGRSLAQGLGRGDRARPPTERLPSSLAAAQWALDRGARILRVHDVAATRQMVDAWATLAAV